MDNGNVRYVGYSLGYCRRILPPGVHGCVRAWMGAPFAKKIHGIYITLCISVLGKCTRGNSTDF